MRWASLLRRPRTVARTSEDYRIGSVSIALTPGHPLPEYQAQFPLYDRLPLVIGAQSFPGWIVDIGANVGDSAAAFVSGPPKRVLCVEPYPEFLAALERNRPALEANGSQIEVAPVAIARTEHILQLSADNGTARSSSHKFGQTVTAMTLDQVVADTCGESAVELIKCDVDGFDAEALLSGLETIAHWKPILYFECDVNFDVLSSYLELGENLLRLGYKIWSFDNFGQPLLKINDISAFQDILTYICGMRELGSKRTFYYIDCLAYSPDSNVAFNIVSQYAVLASRV